jgi:serine/threonine protein kinase
LISRRYRLDEEIGGGGMGIVYRAHDIPNHRDVAIKIINLQKANALTRQQFSQEVEIAARFHHPHIVTVYETGTLHMDMLEPIPFLVMEFVQGTSLDKMHRLTYARILEIGMQICDALAYAHDQGFVYRDLKPGNVLIERRGFQYFVKLTDFGLARPRGEAYLANESSLAGSFFYLAPELIAGQPADIASDLYALGATLFEMITGRVPFSDYDEQTILSQHLEASVAPPSQSRADIPPALEAIVLRLLAKNPKDRFSAAQEVYQALKQVTVARQRDGVQGNLPRRSTERAGRENDIPQIVQLLESNRLVTLLGESGTFTLAAGMQLTDQFLDGIWWVELESVSDPSRVVETLASILGVYPVPDRPLTVSLIEHLHEKNLLLLLNHCGHLLGACAQLAETILNSCPDVWILATSHQPLSVPTEVYYPTGIEPTGLRD